MTQHRLGVVVVVAVVALIGCSRAGAPEASSGAPAAGELSCPGPAGLVVWGKAGPALYLKRDAVPRSVSLAGGEVRDTRVTRDRLYWAAADGVHRSALDGTGATLLWANPDAFLIAVAGERAVVANGDGDLLVLGAGPPRMVASRLQSDSDIFAAAGDRAYVVTSQVRGPAGEGPSSVIWSIDPSGATAPQELAHADWINGFCAGPAGEAIWLELATGPAPRVARVVAHGSPAPLLERSVTSASQLVADADGALFFRADDDVVGVADGKIHATLPSLAVFRGVFGGQAVIEDADGTIRAIPMR